MRAWIKHYTPVKLHQITSAASYRDFILPVLSCTTILPGSCLLQALTLRIVSVGKRLLSLWRHLTFLYFICKASVSVIKKEPLKKKKNHNILQSVALNVNFLLQLFVCSFSFYTKEIAKDRASEKSI